MSDPRPSAPEARLAIGEMAVKSYGNYFLVKKLAEGGMAEIFLAKQVGVEGFEKNVVIKRMLPHLTQVSDFVSMFLDEARLAASLTHPNIVQISDLGLADGCYYICMEYLPGEDFATVLRTAKRRQEHAPLNVVLRVLVEAAVGLHFAHEAVDPRGNPLKLVHRDISPSNIFITYAGQVKVLDFGIAKAESRITSTGAGVVKGKYQYMSPEQARGDAVDRRADVFSLGVSLYEALTGARPFARDTDLAVLKALLGAEYRPLRELRPDLPPEVVQIVERAMAPAAVDRYPSALAFAQAIERFLGATTSATGGQVLVTFMAGFFGPDRVKSKTRVETLEELSARGVDVPGRVNPLSPKTDPGPVSQPRVEPASETRASARPQLEAPASSSRRLALTVAAALVLGVGGTLAVTRLLGGAPVAPVAPAASPPTPVPTPVATTPAPPPAAVADAGPAGEPQAPDAGVEEPPAADAGMSPQPIPLPGPPVKVGPVRLTTAMVSKGISSGKARFQRCFKDFKAELPSPQGTLKVSFAIASSGKVSTATTDLQGTRVSSCIEGALRTMTFPRHQDLEVRVPFALSWDVR